MTPENQPTADELIDRLKRRGDDITRQGFPAFAREFDDAIDLIERQQQEIERLHKILSVCELAANKIVSERKRTHGYYYHAEVDALIELLPALNVICQPPGVNFAAVNAAVKYYTAAEVEQGYMT